MPNSSTKFQVSWLDQTDIDGLKIGDWCTSCKTSKNKAFCTLCLKDISVENSVLPQIQQHAKGEKHRKLSQARFPRLKDILYFLQLVAKAEERTRYLSMYPFKICHNNIRLPQLKRFGP